MGDRRFARAVSDALKEAYADVAPPERLWRRLGADAPVEDALASAPVIAAHRPLRRSVHRWYLMSAAMVIAVIAGVAVLVAQGSSTRRVVSSHPVPPGDLIARCDAPSSRFVRYEVLSAEPLTDYTHTVLVGRSHVPEFSMYFSNGAPGNGTMCVSALASFDNSATHPVMAAATPGTGKIAYLATAYGEPFGAVRPGVVRVTVQVQGDPSASETFSTTDRYERLRPVSSGWHVFNVDYGFWNGAAVLLITAYDAHGRTLDSASLPVDNGARPSPVGHS